MRIRIGCSGYYYRHWLGLFYPENLPASRWFAFYAKQFDTVEINASFYRFPSKSAVRRWHRQAPADFTYSVKAPRLITHQKRFHDCGRLLEDLYHVLAGLGERLGCILFQLPPGLPFSKEALTRVLDGMNPGFRNVIEFRHASWWRQEVYEALREKQVGFCSVSAPELPDDLIVTTPDIYLRLHGNPWYAQSYSEQELAEWSRRIKDAQADYAWVYFNNDSNAFAPGNATAFRELLTA
ncbi:MAG: DUF72 domain-containing protein [Zetaproteobacteria bacterium]|nr:MAG: DUF72 domain-containing protein [Zetaproteobacteria bacterium]